MSWGRRTISCAVVAALSLGACPAFADDSSLVAAEEPSQLRAAPQDLAAGVSLADGTYVFEGFTSSTGMIAVNADDGPATAVVKGDRVALVIDVYNPDKYDGMWAGKRSDAPVDPYDASVVNAVMVPADGFEGPTNTWTDADGLVGDAGATYKASRFVVAMGLDEFAAAFDNGSGGDFYVTVRRAPWSPSNPGKWMGSSDNYLTFSSLKRVSDSTDVPGGFPEGGASEETALVSARRLIDLIPYDPYKVTLSDAVAIHAAESAYAKLTVLEQQQLDAQEAANGVLTYGRSLQCASWGLAALSPVDDSTTLADGTYTTQVTSTCDMGKSSSVRGYKFTVAKVTVQGGHATATLEHATASPDTVSLGGVVYPHSNTDEKAHSTFEVPVDLNSTFHFSQMAKNPTASTIAIPYEMTVSIDEQNATPDPLPSDSANSNGNSGSGSTGGKGSGTSKASSSRRSASAQHSARYPAQRRSAPPAAAPTGSSAPGSRRGADAGPKASGGGNAATPQAAVRPEGGPAPVNRVAAAAPDAAEQAGERPASPENAMAMAVGAIVLAAAGFAAFSLDYLRRDRKRARVSGVRLSDGRE